MTTDARVASAGRVAPIAAAAASRELDRARTVQRALLPTPLSPVSGCEIAALWRPAGAVGGDCYDIVRLSDTRVALSIADVAGKGLPAALLAAHVLATTRAHATVHGPGEVARRVNQTLCGNAALATFVTAFHAVLDLEARTLAFTNAGHAPSLVVRADGTVVRLAAGGPVLGVIPDARYDEETVALRSGDRVLFYTDGITEARSPEGVELGEGRLIDLMASVGRAPAHGMLDTVIAGVCAFSPMIEDDVAMIAVAID